MQTLFRGHQNGQPANPSWIYPVFASGKYTNSSFFCKLMLAWRYYQKRNLHAFNLWDSLIGESHLRGNLSLEDQQRWIICYCGYRNVEEKKNKHFKLVLSEFIPSSKIVGESAIKIYVRNSANRISATQINRTKTDVSHAWCYRTCFLYPTV